MPSLEPKALGVATVNTFNGFDADVGAAFQEEHDRRNGFTIAKIPDHERFGLRGGANGKAAFREDGFHLETVHRFVSWATKRNNPKKNALTGSPRPACAAHFPIVTRPA